MFIPVWVLLICVGLFVAIGIATELRVRAVDRSAKLFRAVAEGASDGLVLMERDSRIIWTNAAYSEVMGYDHGELIGCYPLDYALPPRLAVPPEEVRAFRFDPEEERFGTLTQMENIRKDGSEFIHEFSHAAILIGGDAKFLLVGRDITERVAREKALVAAQERLKNQSMTDTLTGLSNRLHMQTRLDQLVSGGIRFAVLLIDVNQMKQVNDTFGHQAGDAVLLHVARAFRLEAAHDWVCARTGGDEFVALLPGISDLDSAIRQGQRVADAAARAFKWKAATMRVRISVGAAIWDRSLSSSDEVLGHADIALYAAKDAGKGLVVGFDDALREANVEKLALERDVATAMQNREFSFHFQPLFNVETRQVEKFEMLVRWRNGERGNVPPSEFLPLVEQLGLTSEFDNYVVSTAERALERLDRAGLNDTGLSVNLSADVLASDDMTEYLIWRAEEGRLDPRRISLEILESTAVSLSEDDASTRLLDALKRAGFKIFLDDFGMGYAGLAHLAFLPTSGLKIDRGLTSAVDSDPTSRSIVVALIGLARQLGLEVVAEGIENTDQMNIILGAGCPVLQGYAIARPMPLKRAIEWALNDSQGGQRIAG